MNAPSISAANAWIKTFPSPLSTHADGPLSGLKFAVKDNIDVAGVPTTAACPDFAFTPSTHATVVDRLLGAGAQLVGKTNLDQFACGLNGTRSPFGPVPNAVNAAYVSGGSSSGSAFTVASGQVDFALGTDTAGSGRVPAGLNGIVGLKPTKGLISTHGVLPASRSVDCVSIFARNVQTAWRVLLSAMGFDTQDPYSREIQLKTKPFGKSFRFGVPQQLEWYGDTQSENAFAQSIAQMKAIGGQEVRIDYRPFLEVANMLYGSALLAERLEVLDDFFQNQPESVIEPVKTLLEPGLNFSGVDVFKALTKLKTLSQVTSKIWADIDVMLVPTAPSHYRISDMLADPIELNRRLGYYTNFVNLLDYAALSVPSTTRPDGLPFGLTLIAPAGSDWQLAELGMRHQTALAHHSTEVSDAPKGHQNSWSALPIPQQQTDTVQVAVVGAHLSGMPLNGQLTERGAQLIKTTTTADCYRLYALAETEPPKPGLIRVSTNGAPIEIEIWRIPVAEYGSFVSMIPRPLGISQIQTRDGELVQGFICEPTGLEGATDITEFGGWRAYVASRQPTTA